MFQNALNPHGVEVWFVPKRRPVVEVPSLPQREPSDGGFDHYEFPVWFKKCTYLCSRGERAQKRSSCSSFATAFLRENMFQLICLMFPVENLPAALEGFIYPRAVFSRKHAAQYCVGAHLHPRLRARSILGFHWAYNRGPSWMTTALYSELAPLHEFATFLQNTTKRVQKP